jgi:hypothetical protein
LCHFLTPVSDRGCSLGCQLEAVSRQEIRNGSGLPNRSAACESLLGRFFTEWFDTAYPSGTATKPDITGPGLAGPGFYGAGGGACSAA